MEKQFSESRISQSGRGIPGILAAVVDWPSLGFGYLSSGLMVICALIVMYDIVARASGHPTTWGMDYTTYFLVMFVFLSQADGLRADAHINADFLVCKMSVRMQKLMKAIGLLLTFASAGILAYYALLWAIEAIQTGERGFGFTRLILWPGKLTVAISLIFLTLMSLRLLIAEFKQVVRNEESAAFGKGLDNPWLVIPILIVLVVGSCFLINTYPMTGMMLLLVILLASGAPIAFSILAVALAAFFFTFNGLESFATTPGSAYEFVNNYTLLSLPMFIFAGNVMARCGLGEDIFNFALAFVGHIRGGLGIAVAIACTIFGALSGSSPACALTIGTVAYPIMVANGYDKGTSAGLLAASGAIGILIPPSNAAILYGLLTGQPIGTLFIAGIIPGLLMALFMAVTTLYLVKKSGVKTLPKASWKERARVTRKSIWALLMPVVVLGGIYTGIFTITEAAAAAAVYAVVYSLFAGTLGRKQIGKVMSESMHNVAFLLMIMIASILLGKCITMLQLPEQLIAFLGNTPGWVVILVMMIFCIFLGAPLEGSAIQALTVPIMVPILQAYGYDLIWYGVLLTVNTSLAPLSPPVGINLFIMQRIGGLDASTATKGSIPYFIAICVLVIIVALFPALSLWLPAHMMR